jgi:hypothetical protein
MDALARTVAMEKTAVNRTGDTAPATRTKEKSGTPKVQCQLYLKTVHDAHKCYQRFNHSFVREDRSAGNMTINGMGFNPSWYTDPGATDHITADLDKFTMHERYSGKDQVHTMNG